MQSNDHSRTPGWRFVHSYAGLPEAFHTRAQPAKVTAPRMAIFNRRFAEALGLDVQAAEMDQWASALSGHQLPIGARPVAQAYAGHQFGHFTMLGDGRAILLGEHMTPDGRQLDVQLKGAGQTAYSRRGDGLAALGPMLREYIISEAMHALGIPTTRSLAVVMTGDPVYRESVLPGAVLTRVAESHLRVGTFQYAASRRNVDELRSLADYTIARHYPELQGTDQPYLGLLRTVIDRQARLISQWMLVGFIHGVMNTDNMAIGGQTIDYGPCAFMDAFDLDTVFSSIDHHGRYAYGNQPGIAQWNLARFAETLLPLLHENADEALRLGEFEILAFQEIYKNHWLDGMRAKLGLSNAEEDDVDLAEDLVACMQQSGADHTNTYVALASQREDQSPRMLTENLQAWKRRWETRVARQPSGMPAAIDLMQRVNPVVIPRNHLVEEALQQAESQGDFSAIQRLLEVLSTPYTMPEDRRYCDPAPPSSAPYQTFCGT